ncbi:hypothetical protein PCE1_004766 [Barthelona sp. PCE]
MYLITPRYPYVERIKKKTEFLSLYNSYAPKEFSTNITVSGDSKIILSDKLVLCSGSFVLNHATTALGMVSLPNYDEYDIIYKDSHDNKCVVSMNSTLKYGRYSFIDYKQKCFIPSYNNDLPLYFIGQSHARHFHGVYYKQKSTCPLSRDVERMESYISIEPSFTNRFPNINVQENAVGVLFGGDWELAFRATPEQMYGRLHKMVLHISKSFSRLVVVGTPAQYRETDPWLRKAYSVTEYLRASEDVRSTTYKRIDHVDFDALSRFWADSNVADPKHMLSVRIETILDVLTFVIKGKDHVQNADERFIVLPT